MHGGNLQSSNIIHIQQHDLLLAAFSNQLYFFSLAEGTLLTKATSHDAPILYIHYLPQTKVVTSVDSAGVVVQNWLSKKGAFEKKSRSRKAFGGERLKDARVVCNKKGQIEVYGLTQSDRLLRNSQKLTGTVNDVCSKILYISTEYLILRTEEDKLVVVNPQSLKVLFHYSHNCQITAAQIFELNVLIGDSKGKITILNGFLEEGEVKLRQKLQWHVHDITSLRVEGAYLYSSGEEGVVVMWHLRENKNDFLPRIGAKILNLIIKESKIYCMLADNTIKAIDIGEDKAVVQYKLVISTTMEHTSQLSNQKVKNNTVRVSGLQDRLFMRSMPGRIQEINLSNGLNTEHQIVGRNLISRLDSSFPSPHQITDMCLSRDSSRIALTVEGVNCRSLRFYEAQGDRYQLVSKVENVHSGQEPIHILILGQKFVSYSQNDQAIKIWKLMSKKKQSILEIQQHFWGCEYQINYRSKTPLHVSTLGERLTVSYQHQFVVFNTQNKTIESVYQTDGEKQIIAIFNLVSDYKHNKHVYLAIFKNSLEVLEYSKHGQTATVVMTTNIGESAIENWNISYNDKSQAVALLLEDEEKQQIIVYKYGEGAQQYEIERTEKSWVTDVFWLGQRVIVLDSQLIFYDITHGKDIVSFGGKRENIAIESQQKVFQEETSSSADYQTLYNRYLQRQFRRDNISLQKANDVISVTPSITTAFDYLAKQLFL